MNRRTFFASLLALLMPWRKAEAKPVKPLIRFMALEGGVFRGPFRFTLEPGTYRITDSNGFEQITLGASRTFDWPEVPTKIVRIA